MIRNVSKLLIVLGFTATASRIGLAQETIPFVPSPMHVVHKMIEVAEIKKGDILYDMGSGDGRIVQVEAQATPELVSISVVDQGIGIAAKDHQRIFERFYRVDRARSRSTGGSGLGLSIVRHVVSNHGGTVSVVSEEGRGSTFTMVLPREESLPATQATSKSVTV